MTMATEAFAPRVPLTRDESGALFGQTMVLVGFVAGAFALGCYLARNVGPGWGWLLFIAAFAALLGIAAAASRSEQLALGLLCTFGLLLGAAVAPTVAYYARTEPHTVWNAGAATALFIAGFGAAGYATRRDLTKLARSLTWALVGLLVFGVVAVIAQIPNGSLIYTIGGLIIFAGLTSYDFQRLRKAKDLRTAPLLAASIFLDILNVFLLFLSFGSDGE
jgi:FtsH-binding integral membrane protein